MNCDAVVPVAKAWDGTHELVAAVADSLLASRHVELALVDCEATGDRLVLRGSVPSYRLKQLAQTLAMRVWSVGRIENRLTVCPPGEWFDAERRAIP